MNYLYQNEDAEKLLEEIKNFTNYYNCISTCRYGSPVYQII